MSSNALKDKITGLLANIINQSKAENLIVLELQDLLLQLKNITIFDGLELFIDVISSKDGYEAQKINEFLTIHLEDIAMFDSVYLFVKNLNIQIQDSVQLDEVRNYASVSDEKEKADEEMLAGLRSEMSKMNEEKSEHFAKPSPPPSKAPQSPPPPSPTPTPSQGAARSLSGKGAPGSGPMESIDKKMKSSAPKKDKKARKKSKKEKNVLMDST